MLPEVAPFEFVFMLFFLSKHTKKQLKVKSHVGVFLEKSIYNMLGMKTSNADINRGVVN